MHATPLAKPARWPIRQLPARVATSLATTAATSQPPTPATASTATTKSPILLPPLTPISTSVFHVCSASTLAKLAHRIRPVQAAKPRWAEWPTPPLASAPATQATTTICSTRPASPVPTPAILAHPTPPA